MKRFISTIFAVILMLLLISTAANAFNLQPSTLTVIVKYGDTPLSGIHIALCRVADAREENDAVVYKAVPAFSGTGADFTALVRSESAALDSILNIYRSNTAIATITKFTDSDGKAVFPDLAAGLYLVTQLNAESGKYRITPFLVAVPNPSVTGGGWNYNVIARPKAELIKAAGEMVSVSVYVLWKGTANPPGNVSVQLYRNGNAYGNPVLLNGDDFWRYTWHNLNSNDTWTVDEPNVPGGYIKSISGNAGSGFIITNTKVSDDSCRPTLPITPTLPISLYPTGGAGPQSPGGPGSYGGGPKTDDGSNMQLWILLILSASAGLLAAVWMLTRTLKNKRRR